VLPAVWEWPSHARSHSGIAICTGGSFPEPLHAFANELRRAHLSPLSPFKLTVYAGAANPGGTTFSGGIPIELLVNNAALSARRIPRQFSAPAMEMLRLNNQAIVELTYSLLPGMLERGKRDHKYLLHSRLSTDTFRSAYSATKRSSLRFHWLLNRNCAPLGKRCTLCREGCTRSKTETQGARQRKMGKHLSESRAVVEEALRVLPTEAGSAFPGALNKFSVFAQRLIPKNCAEIGRKVIEGVINNIERSRLWLFQNHLRAHAMSFLSPFLDYCLFSAHAGLDAGHSHASRS